jgi:hypothetical protein
MNCLLVAAVLRHAGRDRDHGSFQRRHGISNQKDAVAPECSRRADMVSSLSSIASGAGAMNTQ